MVRPKRKLPEEERVKGWGKIVEVTVTKSCNTCLVSGFVIITQTQSTLAANKLNDD